MPGPAATLSSMHVCPMLTPGLPPIPHVGGPITGPGVPTVLIGGKPAAVMGDMCTCTGPPDTIVMGVPNVLIGGKPAATMGSMTAHGGSIVFGVPNVLIGTSAVLPSAIMLIKDIPFPKITSFDKMMAKLSGKSLSEAQANQEILREESKRHHENNP